MATIRKNSAGNYEARVYIGRDENGKQLFEYVTRAGLKEIKAAVRDIEDRIASGKMIVVGNVKVNAWFDEWMKNNKNRLSPSTYVNYLDYVEKHFKPFFKQYKLGQLNEIIITRYMNKKLETLSVTSVRKHMFVLRRILHDALKDKNPAADIQLPSPTKFKPHVVTDEEFDKIFKAVKGRKYEAIVLLSAWCGLRRGEIFALKWDDIDKENKTIRVDEGIAISEKGYVEKRPKSENGFRTIAVPEYLINLFEGLRTSQKEIKQRIFPGRPDNFTKWFMKLMDTLGMSDIRFHDLRHYHASFLYKNAIPDHYAAQRLGHDIYTLKKIYQHIDAGTKKEIDNNIIALIQNPGM